jgi:glycosyltransferase involved in cell wall biosynthesis
MPSSLYGAAPTEDRLVRSPPPSEPLHATWPDVTISTSGHDVADARLHREVEALTRAGLSVEIFGLGDPSGAPPVTSVRTWHRRGPVSRLLLAITLPWRARGRVLFTLDPDLIPAAWLRTRYGHRRLVVDIHEDYRAVLRDRPWARSVLGFGAHTLVRIANVLAARADLTVLADAHLPRTRTQRSLVVPNLPVSSFLAPRAPLDPAPRAIYVGDVRRSRGLRSMLAAIEEAPGWSLDIVGPVAASDQGWLTRWQATSPAASRVRFHGRRPPREAWSLARGAWAGLALLEDTPAFRAAVPSKLYEYLAAGLAVVATSLPRVEQIVSQSGAGVVVPDAAEASATLRKWSGDPEQVARLQQVALSWARHHLGGVSPYDELAAAVLELARSPEGARR